MKWHTVMRIIAQEGIRKEESLEKK